MKNIKIYTKENKIYEFENITFGFDGPILWVKTDEKSICFPLVQITHYEWSDCSE